MADEMTIALDIATAKMRLARLQARTAAFHSRMDDAEADVERLHAALTVHLGAAKTAADVPNTPPAPPVPLPPPPAPAASSVNPTVNLAPVVANAAFPVPDAGVVSAQAPPPPAST